MLKKFILLLLIVMLANNAIAATIHGTVFNLYLDELEGTVVKINTVPEQVKVAKDATYSFNVPKGEYVITAVYQNDDEFGIKQNITIKDNGDYALDLILLPEFEEDILGDIEIDEGEKKVSSWLILFIIVINLLVVTYLIRWFTAKKKSGVKEEKENIGSLEGLVDFIKNQGGRVTQKDIRRKFPLSEAKISLMITELEHKGVVEKIKKGRGNVIILKK